VTRGSLRLRLLFAGAISVVAALTLSGFGLVLLFERHVERRAEAELDVYLDQIVAGVDRLSDGDIVMSKAPTDPRFAKPYSGLYWQVQVGDTMLRSRSLWDTRLFLPPGGTASGSILRHRIAGPNDTELLAAERRLTLSPRLGGGAMRAVVAVDSADVTVAAHSFAVDLAPYLVVIAVLLIAAAYAQVAVGLRPLATVRDRLLAIREGKARRLGQGFPDEIVPLAAEVDALLEAREAQIEKARARAGDLAHGLKTPLQVLVGDVARLRENGDAEIAAEIEEVATAMRRRVDRELARARIAVGGREALANIADVVEQVVAVVVRTPAGSRLDWSVDIPRGRVGRIDPDDLAEAIGNLVENAARHARGRVSIRSRCDIGCVIVTVSDDGPGIPAEHLGDVLTRGGRLDQSGGGAGLGLAIVGDIAEAWHGRLEIRTGAAGLEADFCVPAGDRGRGTGVSGSE
jgi:signal transduction histidine kinase